MLGGRNNDGDAVGGMHQTVCTNPHHVQLQYRFSTALEMQNDEPAFGLPRLTLAAHPSRCRHDVRCLVALGGTEGLCQAEGEAHRALFPRCWPSPHIPGASNLHLVLA